MSWKKILIGAGNVKSWSGDGVLIACPRHSGYGGWSFWYPARLLREHGDSYEMIYGEEFTFRIRKGKEGDVIDADELESMFTVLDDGNETHRPETLVAEKAEALDELKEK